MSPMSSLLPYKHLRSWIPLPFAFAGNNNSPSTVDTKSDAISATETPENVSVGSAPTPPVRNAPIPRPPPRHSSVPTSRQPQTSIAQNPTANTALKENALPPPLSNFLNSQETISPPPFSQPILASTPPASPIIHHPPHPQRPPPTPLPTSPQTRGRTLIRTTSARRTLFPSRSSISLRQREPLRSTSNTTHHRPKSPQPPPPPPPPPLLPRPTPSPKFPRYLGRHPSINSTQLRSARLPPLHEQGSLQATTPPLLSRPSTELKKQSTYRSPSGSSYQVAEDMARLYCGGEEKPGFVKVRSQRQLRAVVLRRQGVVHAATERRASDDSGRTTRGGSEVPIREVGVGCGGDGSDEGGRGRGRGEGVGVGRGKKRGREKGLRGRVGRLGRRLSVGDRRRKKREVEGGWDGDWDGEERGKEEGCE